MIKVLAAILLFLATLPSTLLAQNPPSSSGERVTANKGSRKSAPGKSSLSPNTNFEELGSRHSSATGSKLRAPATSEPVGSEPNENALTNIYRVGVGDVLDVRVRNLSSGGSTLFTVLEGGIIDFPLLGGPLTVAGYTTEEIQNRMAVEFRRRALSDAAQVTVSVRQYASHSIIITGLVVSGGTKMLRREAVPLYVILAESQSRLDAARANIMRGSNPVMTVDLTDPSSSSVLIRPGDVINIAARPDLFYYIGGRIDYPGQKVFQSGITLFQSILAAGGARSRSDSVVEMSREGSSGNLTTTKYNLKDIKSGKVPDPRLQPGDRIEVLR
jgi:protein involved in polysaccharide export with SLBB domain